MRSAILTRFAYRDLALWANVVGQIPNCATLTKRQTVDAKHVGDILVGIGERKRTIVSASKGPANTERADKRRGYRYKSAPKIGSRTPHRSRHSTSTH